MNKTTMPLYGLLLMLIWQAPCPTLAAGATAAKTASATRSTLPSKVSETLPARLKEPPLVPAPSRQHQLQGVRRLLRTSRMDIFRLGQPKRGAASLLLARNSLVELQSRTRHHWNDPMYAERLGLVTRTVKAMADGRLAQTPALFDKMDWELGALIHSPWEPS